MSQGNYSQRARQLLDMNRARARQSSVHSKKSTPNSRESPLFLPESPPATPSPAKRRRTIKVEEDSHDYMPSYNSQVPRDIPAMDFRADDVPADPAEVPESVLALDPKASESSLPALDDDQRKALKLVLSGKNMFITGSAGCGKSTLLRWVVMLLRSRGRTVWVTAPTGQAACQVGGATLHSYMGWGPDAQKKSINEIARHALNPAIRARINETQVLIIDEISMVSRNMLDRVNRAIQSASGESEEMFAGKQIIFCGDFFQLAPVKPNETCYACGKDFGENPWTTWTEHNGRNVETIQCQKCPSSENVVLDEFWAFNSAVWQDESLNLAYIHLKKNHRQNEERFMSTLSRLRTDPKALTAEQKALILRPNPGVDGVTLYVRKREAWLHNARELGKLPGAPVVFSCYDDIIVQPDHQLVLQNRTKRSTIDGTLLQFLEHRYAATLELKRGMPVILLANLNVGRGLVNGSQGKIVDFESFHEMTIVGAAGINRTPGTESAYTDAEDAYIIRKTFSEHAVQQREQCNQFLLHKQNGEQKWPVVQFDNDMRVIVFANCAMAQLGDDQPYSLEMRTQIPLAPGWAMTVHKAQGMTLEKVVIDMAHTTFDGIAYVALSRAKTLAGLRVITLGGSLDKEPNEEVQRFYQSIIWDIGGFR